MLVAVKFLSDDVMKDTINYKNFLKQTKSVIFIKGAWSENTGIHSRDE